MSSSLKTLISLYRDEIIAVIGVLVFILSIGVSLLIYRQANILESQNELQIGVERTVQNDSIQLNNQDSLKDYSSSLKHKLDSLNKK